VRGFSWSLERTLDVGGAAGLSTAANKRRAGRISDPAAARRATSQLK
jgi:hypothetical protein